MNLSVVVDVDVFAEAPATMDSGRAMVGARPVAIRRAPFSPRPLRQ